VEGNQVSRKRKTSERGRRKKGGREEGTVKGRNRNRVERLHIGERWLVARKRKGSRAWGREEKGRKGGEQLDKRSQRIVKQGGRGGPKEGEGGESEERTM